MAELLMPKATAVWLVDSTTLTFDQIAAFCGLHPLEVQGIADGEVAIGIRGSIPLQTGRSAVRRSSVASRIRRSGWRPSARLWRSRNAPGAPATRRVSKRQDRPNAIAWLLKNYDELSDAQIGKLLGTTKATITAVRERTHWNTPNITPQDPILLGICNEAELLDAVRKARAKAERAAARDEKAAAAKAAAAAVEATPAQPVEAAPAAAPEAEPGDPGPADPGMAGEGSGSAGTLQPEAAES